MVQLLGRKYFQTLGVVFRVKYDSKDKSLYVTGAKSFSGSGSKDGKVHPNCMHDACAVILRLAASSGEVQWVRTMKGSPRWGVFDQSGGVEIASENDGPYIYVAIDDTGECSMDEAVSVALI